MIRWSHVRLVIMVASFVVLPPCRPAHGQQSLDVRLQLISAGNAFPLDGTLDGEKPLLMRAYGWESMQQGFAGTLVHDLRALLADPSSSLHRRLRELCALTGKPIVIRVFVHLDPDTGRPVWPHAHRSEGWVDLPHVLPPGFGTLEDLAVLIAHEVAHVQDRGRYDGALGPDGAHYCSEITSPLTAMVEGWAEYQGALAGPSAAAAVTGSCRTRLTWETRWWELHARVLGGHHPGGYRVVDRPTYAEYTASESTVACFLLALDDGGRHRSDVAATFAATNEPGAERTLESYAVAYAWAHPEQALRAAAQLDLLTDGQVPDGVLELMLGPSGQLSEYTAGRPVLRTTATEWVNRLPLPEALRRMNAMWPDRPLANTARPTGAGADLSLLGIGMP